MRGFLIRQYIKRAPKFLTGNNFWLHFKVELKNKRLKLGSHVEQKPHA